MSQSYDPADLQAREKLLFEHPVLEREYIVETPMISRAYRLVQSHVLTRRTGLVFFAKPRMGKTRCAMAVKDRIQLDFPSVYVTLMSVRASARYSESHIPRLILEAERHIGRNANRSTRLLETAISDIRVKVGAVNGKQYVAIIDEAHLLNEGDWQQLVCFHNALELYNIKMTTISFAQPTILHRRTALQASQDEQIIARFLSMPVSFEGCGSEKDLRVLLSAFDSGSEFPEDSSCSYTNFFVPVAYKNGFQLKNYANKLWSAFLKSAGNFSGGMVSVELICLVLAELLLTLMKQDCPGLVLSDDEIELALSSCNFYSYQDIPED